MFRVQGCRPYPSKVVTKFISAKHLSKFVHELSTFTQGGIKILHFKVFLPPLDYRYYKNSIRLLITLYIFLSKTEQRYVSDCLLALMQNQLESVQRSLEAPPSLGTDTEVFQGDVFFLNNSKD